MSKLPATLLKAGALLLALTAAASAQDYPTKPVRLLIPFAPGGSVDIVARSVAARLGERLGKQVLADNRPGGSTTIATEIAVNSPPDGHTLLMISFTHAVSPWVMKVPYDSRRAFVPVAILGKGVNVLTVNPSIPANSVKELIALAKSKPKQLLFANAGIGSFTHISSALFATMAGIEVEHVSFRGTGPATIDVIGGHSQVILTSTISSIPHIKSGKLKALGLSDTKRSPLLPDVPTVDEAGLPGYEASNWWGIAVPAGTPQPVIDRLHREIQAVLSLEEIKTQFANDGAVIVQMSPAESRQFFLDEMEKWGKVVKEANIKAQ